MSKVLGVVGSPRRNGNTHLLVERILEAARAAGAETELLFLADVAPYECNGCHACWRGEICSKKDAMNLWFPRIAEADGIVFGTPVYWYGPTGLMKMFLDRFVYFNCPEHRDRIRGHAAALAIPFEETNPHMADLLIEIFAKSFQYLELEHLGNVLAPGMQEKGDVLKLAEVLAEAADLGRRLAAHGTPAARASELAGIMHRLQLKREV